MNQRDYVTLFAYFIGARGNHAVHVRALIHAGFIVEATNKESVSFVKSPVDNEIIGCIVGKDSAVIGRFRPPDKVARIKEGSGY